MNDPRKNEKRDLAFTGAKIDRRASFRESKQNSLVVELAGDRAVVRNDGEQGYELAYFHHDGAQEAVHLGRREDGAAILAVAIEETAVRKGHVLVDLRSLAMEGLLQSDELALLAQARSFLSWHQRHGFCANCGHPTRSADGGHRRDCGQCATQHFPRTDPVVIVAVTGPSGLLLGRGAHFQPGVYSALAGFMEPGETIEEAARREVQEESGIRLGPVSYLASQPWPFPSSLMIGVLGTALNEDVIIDATELEDARWFSSVEIGQMMNGTHAQGLKVPRPAAIAYHLIAAACERFDR